MDFLFSPQWLSYLFDIFLAGLLGYIVGVEREVIGKEAGARTLALVTIGSCLFTILSREAFLDLGSGADPSRIAAAVVMGLGFLAGGIIIFKKEKIEGLTTASALWSMGGVGMAIGSHFYSLALIATFFIFIILVLRIDIEEKLKKIKENQKSIKR